MRKSVDVCGDWDIMKMNESAHSGDAWAEWKKTRQKDRDGSGALAMKNRCLIVACMILSTAFGCIVHKEQCPALNSVEETAPESIRRDALKRQLEYYLSYWFHSGVVTCAENEEQALNLFEAYIVPTLGDRSENRIRRLKNRIVEGRAWVYQLVSGDWHQCYLLDLAPCSSESLGCGFHYIVGSRNRLTGVVNPPVEHHLMLELCPRVNDPGDKRRLSAYEESCRWLPRLKDAIPRHGDICPHDPNSPDVILAVVDVTDVVLVRVEGFDHQRYHACSLGGESCSGLYRIRLDVREVVRGELPSEIYILETSWPWEHFKLNQWLFYRGMTLRVSLCRDKGDLLLVDAIPVEPCPPYSKVTQINGVCWWADFLQAMMSGGLNLWSLNMEHIPRLNSGMAI